MPDLHGVFGRCGLNHPIGGNVLRLDGTYHFELRVQTYSSEYFGPWVGNPSWSPIVKATQSFVLMCNSDAKLLYMHQGI
jgi:hypothetical protein